MMQQCCKIIDIPKRLKQPGVDARCQKYTKKICEKCGNYFCYLHIEPEKHECESLEKGVLPQSNETEVGE